MISRSLVVLAALGVFATSRIDDEDWTAVVKSYVESMEAIKDPRPVAYPWVARRLKTLFEVEGVGHIQVFTEEGGKKVLYSEIYYSKGELHVVDHKKGWYLVTRGDGVYEWDKEQKEGIITKATAKDLIDYLIYLTDPSYIMTDLYYSVLQSPEQFLPPKDLEGGTVEWRFRKALEGFQSVLVSQEPAWLCGFETRNPVTGETNRVTFTKPESLKQLPAELLDRMKGIKFEKSDLSIRRHMIYL
jgi:hypothetical protein